MLRKESHAGLLRTEKGYELSVYSGSIATNNEIAVGMSRLRIAFPKQSQEFFNLLSERVIKNGFSSDRIKDAINYTIDNFAYKELNISDIIKFDRRVKLYTYNEVCQLVTKGLADFSEFEIREVEGRSFRVKKTDI
jgi:hypothetical protein